MQVSVPGAAQGIIILLHKLVSDSDIDVIPLAFLDVINGPGGEPEINFANQGNDCSTFSGTALLDCPQIG